LNVLIPSSGIRLLRNRTMIASTCAHATLLKSQWKELVRASATTPQALARALDLDQGTLRRVADRFRFCVNPYYMGLIRERGDPIWRQAVPDIRELESTGMEDPLAEERDSPVRGVVHRYPDRVLFYVSHACSMYCRFCTRKRKVADPLSAGEEQYRLGLDYIREHPEVRDVVISGGDPLMLEDDRIDRILAGLRAIRHVEIIRIGTRMPVALPQRITDDLCSILKRYHPLYVNTHFNHPWEVTEESRRACGMLAEAGIPLGNQSVLLRGVNDDPLVMRELVQKLLAIRVKPYYIYMVDLARGIQHFRTPLSKGLEIIEAIRGHTSGMAVPTLVVDAPGGGGKIPIAPETIVSVDDREVTLRNYRGQIYRYPTHPPA
jgi:lysine 2,3-aminomutase